MKAIKKMLDGSSIKIKYNKKESNVYDYDF